MEESSPKHNSETSPKHNPESSSISEEKNNDEQSKPVEITAEEEEDSPKHNVEIENKIEEHMKMEQEFEETMKFVSEEVSPKQNVETENKRIEEQGFLETMELVGEGVSPKQNVEIENKIEEHKTMEQEFEETMRSVSEEDSPKHNVEIENKVEEHKKMEQEFEETMRSVGQEVSPKHSVEFENKKMEQDFEETMRSVGQEVSLKHSAEFENKKMEQEFEDKVSSKQNVEIENKKMEQEFEETMKSLADNISPKDNVEIENKKMEAQEFEEIMKPVAENISPKDDVEIENKKMEEQEFEEIMKSVGEKVSLKHNVETEEEMEEIDIHEEDKTDDDDDDDTESSSDSKDQETKEEKEEEPKPPVAQSSPQDSQDPNSTTSIWTEKAAAIKNFVRVKSEVAVHRFMRRLSGKLSIESAAHDIPSGGKETKNDVSKETKHVESPKAEGKSIWNPLSYLKMMQNDDSFDKVEARTMEAELEPVMMKGRIILYTRLGCEECRECRLYLHEKRLRYVEINVDIYPTRKLELEKIAGPSSDVPKVFFNEELVGSLKKLKEMEESGEFEEKIKHLVAEAPPREAPLPPFSGEDDASSKGPVDELALIVRRMKPSIVRDRFYKMRRFKNCFSGSEAVDFLTADQHLEREEAVEVARKLASQLFFQHVLEENLFEDGNHLYRFLDDDPIVSSQCHNIPRGIIELKPRPIVEIAYRLRLLYRSILEAYTSPDGKHVDYRSIHGSEEFARYLRMIQELHRVEIEDMQREEKLAFFLNLYNMMAIHAILVWGHPAGPLERTKMFGEFKYVIGGYTYSLSAIQNGILRGNQRPPYNLMKPFGAKDKRSKVALPYAEPLSHFGLVCGTRSGPPLRCFSPGEIDKELMEAARDFLRSGGLIVDLNSKVAYISKIFNCYGVDFGKGEEEVLKHASTYLEPQLSEALLDLLVDTQFRVVYQAYDWGLNN